MAEQYTTGRTTTNNDAVRMPDPTGATSSHSRLARWIPLLIAFTVLTLIIAGALRNNAGPNSASGQAQQSGAIDADSRTAPRSNGMIPAER